MTGARALVGIGSLLVATTVPATLLGGCTKGMGTSTVSMAQPAPRARTTTGATSYTPVTDQRLVSPEAENWLMYRRTYDGWGYSPLEQINAGNVKDLVPVWSFSTGVAEGHQAPPIVNNGIMFVSTPQNQVLALDAKSGERLWRYKRELPEDLFQLHPTNRGVGLYEDKLYLATLDAHVVALDAKTGKLLWDRTVEDLAPLVAKGKVMVGVSGGELGIRGFVQALDARTGAPAWKGRRVRLDHGQLRIRRSPSVRRCGAARTGRRPATIRRPAICTSRATRTSAAPSSAPRNPTRKASSGWAPRSRTSGWSSRTGRSTSVRSRPGT
jgi:glucose dehydrogenase